MKKITSLIVLTIIILTCIFAFVACGDKADPNDPVLGWYCGDNIGLVHFSIVDGKLVYNLQDGTTNIAVTKNGNEYTVNSYVFTLTTVNGIKQLNANTIVGPTGSKNFRYLTSSDKTYEEATEILKTDGNPWKK